MNFTWEDIFSIVENMFTDLKQEDIAKCLGVEDYTISKLRNGHTNKFANGKSKTEAIYKNLFDPRIKGTPAYETKGDEKYLLSILKDTIIAVELSPTTFDLYILLVLF